LSGRLIEEITMSRAFYGAAFGWRRFHFADPHGYELAVWSDK
jgi:predicted enzyme related to lactoylglutathione lyase